MKTSEAVDLASIVVIVVGIVLRLSGHISSDTNLSLLVAAVYLQVWANRERFKEL